MVYFKTIPGVRGAVDNPQLQTSWEPLADITESDKGYTIEIDVPGVGKEDVKVSYKDSILTISGERKLPEGGTADNVQHFERCRGNFSRSFRLPHHADGDTITGSYINGVLTLEIPKKKEAQPREIDIK